jgi:hypothetical protein
MLLCLIVDVVDEEYCFEGWLSNLRFETPIGTPNCGVVPMRGGLCDAPHLSAERRQVCLGPAASTRRHNVTSYRVRGTIGNPTGRIRRTAQPSGPKTCCRLVHSRRQSSEARNWCTRMIRMKEFQCSRLGYRQILCLRSRHRYQSPVSVMVTQYQYRAGGRSKNHPLHRFPLLPPSCLPRGLLLHSFSILQLIMLDSGHAGATFAGLTALLGLAQALLSQSHHGLRARIFNPTTGYFVGHLLAAITFFCVWKIPSSLTWRHVAFQLLLENAWIEGLGITVSPGTAVHFNC